MSTQVFIIAFLIFLARVVDVSIGTVRIIFINRGLRTFAALLGFLEILIWLLAISQIMQNLNNVLNYVAFAAGFATGNFVGISLENKISLGNLTIRIFTVKDAQDLISTLIHKGYGVTTVDAQGSKGPVKIIYTVTPRKNIKEIIECIRTYNPQAFYTIEDIRCVAQSNACCPVGANNPGRRSPLFLKKK